MDLRRTLRRLRHNSKAYSNATFFQEKPRPIPLANSKDERNLQETIKDFQGRLEKGDDEVKLTMMTPMKAFENNKNPTSGEVGGPKGPEPTRFGDWERKGRVIDF